MLTPKEYALIAPDAATQFGLDQREWGALLCVDALGQKWTCITEDIAYWHLLVDAPHDVRAGMIVASGKFDRKRAGWPDDWR